MRWNGKIINLLDSKVIISRLPAPLPTVPDLQWVTLLPLRLIELSAGLVLKQYRARRPDETLIG